MASNVPSSPSGIMNVSDQANPRHKNDKQVSAARSETNNQTIDKSADSAWVNHAKDPTTGPPRTSTSTDGNHSRVIAKLEEEAKQERRSVEKQNAISPEFKVQFWSIDDPADPKNMPTWRKWTIVLILAASAISVTSTSAIYVTTYAQIRPEFHISNEVAVLGLTLFVCGLGLGPMMLGPLSEFYGRRIIYVCAFGLYVIWLVPCAVAPNLATMLVSRFFDGLAGSAFLSVAGGSVGDMFRKENLGTPMMVYTASPFLGPEVGPIIGGFISQYTNWRWTFWVSLIWAGALWVLIVTSVPETYAPVLLRRKAQKLRKQTEDGRWKAPIEVMDRSVLRTILWSCIRPFQLIFLEPMCLNLCLLSAILLGIIYLFLGAFPIVFQGTYGFNEWQTGLTFLGLLVGMLVGVGCDPLWRRNYQRLVRNNDGVSEPEFRLPPTICGAVVVPISLFGFGWTTFSHVHWIAPIIFSGLFGLGNIFCFSGIFTFQVEAYPLYAASALAANSFVRSSFACSWPLFGDQLYHTLGDQWASSLLGFIALVMTPFPYVFFLYGKHIRSTSRFSSTRS